MYETLCSLGALLFQGVAAGLCIFGLTKWFDCKDSRVRYKAAAMFIRMEVLGQRDLLDKIANHNKPFLPDSPATFSTYSWLDFRSDLVGHVSVDKLKEIAAYYHSIDQICTASNYDERKALATSAYAENKVICDLLNPGADN